LEDDENFVSSKIAWNSAQPRYVDQLNEIDDQGNVEAPSLAERAELAPAVQAPPDVDSEPTGATLQLESILQYLEPAVSGIEQGTPATTEFLEFHPAPELDLHPGQMEPGALLNTQLLDVDDAPNRVPSVGEPDEVNPHSDGASSLDSIAPANIACSQDPMDAALEYAARVMSENKHLTLDLLRQPIERDDSDINVTLMMDDSYEVEEWKNDLARLGMNVSELGPEWDLPNDEPEDLTESKVLSEIEALLDQDDAEDPGVPDSYSDPQAFDVLRQAQVEGWESKLEAPTPAARNRAPGRSDNPSSSEHGRSGPLNQPAHKGTHRPRVETERASPESAHGTTLVGRPSQSVPDGQERPSHRTTPIAGAAGSVTAFENEIQSRLELHHVLTAYQGLAKQIRSDVPQPNAASVVLFGCDDEPSVHEVAAGLARLFASSGASRVLLVDGNLTRQRITRSFLLDDDRGLAEACVGVPWRQFVVPTHQNNLFVLPAGGRFDRRHIREDLLITLVTQWNKEYQIVVVDVGDANSPFARPFMHACDVSYFVVCLGRTARSKAVATLDSLKEVKMQPAGCILNNVQRS
jgi:Mrp family chromosome partitioning ATPase